jgi:hypothetical protein
MRKLLLFIYCAFPTLFYAQVEKYTPKVNLAIETYAFLKGQSAALRMVAIQFPSLQTNVTAAEKSSRVLFGRAERNIEHFLKDELENTEFNKLQNDLNSLINEQFKYPIEKQKHALDFLEKVRDRPRFISDTLLLKGIISFAYHDAPHQEITDGHIKFFNTKNHPKAGKATVKLSLPKSWLAEEAEMPETIQQFTSHYGKGNEKFLIVIYNLVEEENDITLDKKSILEMISPETKLIRTETVTIDGNPGMMIEVEEIINSANNQMKVRMLQFMFVQKKKLYCLQGSIGPVEVSKNLDRHIKKYEPLFRIIASNTQIDN